MSEETHFCQSCEIFVSGIVIHRHFNSKRIVVRTSDGCGHSCILGLDRRRFTGHERVLQLRAEQAPINEPENLDLYANAKPAEPQPPVEQIKPSTVLNDSESPPITRAESLADKLRRNAVSLLEVSGEDAKDAPDETAFQD